MRKTAFHFPGSLPELTNGWETWVGEGRKSRNSVQADRNSVAWVTTVGIENQSQESNPCFRHKHPKWWLNHRAETSALESVTLKSQEWRPIPENLLLANRANPTAKSPRSPDRGKAQDTERGALHYSPHLSFPALNSKYQYSSYLQFLNCQDLLRTPALNTLFILPEVANSRPNRDHFLSATSEPFVNYTLLPPHCFNTF